MVSVSVSKKLNHYKILNISAIQGKHKSLRVYSTATCNFFNLQPSNIYENIFYLPHLLL